MVSLFEYSNDTFIVQSFMPNNIDFKVITRKNVTELIDLEIDEIIKDYLDPVTKSMHFPVSMTPYLTPYRVFKLKY